MIMNGEVKKERKNGRGLFNTLYWSSHGLGKTANIRIH
jgi:hypothetical protein